MIGKGIEALARGRDLCYEEAAEIMGEIMEGGSTEALTAAYLTALACKGETVDEICGSAQAMREHAAPFPDDMPVLEIVGTGGDRSGSFNVSTTSAIVLASLGVPVAKHGNRAATSRCGAADVLEALGVVIDLPPARMARMLRETGFCFLFAQRYHTAMKYVAPVRRQLPIRTVFNVLGPLTNPANVQTQMTGVCSEELIVPMARVLSRLGVKRGMVFYGTDGLDEISPSAPTKACRFEGERLEEFLIEPKEYGFPACKKEDIAGGAPEENAAITRAVLAGGEGAYRTAVVLNCAFSLSAQRGVSVRDGIACAERALSDGTAAKKLEEIVRVSNRI